MLKLSDRLLRGVDSGGSSIWIWTAVGGSALTVAATALAVRQLVRAHEVNDVLLGVGLFIPALLFAAFALGGFLGIEEARRSREG